ncbi:hypothetical protein HZA57_08990 [Candidatus Poribacteria bacterium]|nr:hypothetical protein [Candidatus Poribacteria bacterium]
MRTAIWLLLRPALWKYSGNIGKVRPTTEKIPIMGIAKAMGELRMTSRAAGASGPEVADGAEAFKKGIPVSRHVGG